MSYVKLPYLHAWRKRACLTQAMLADFSGLSRVCIVHLEQQRYGAAPRSLHALAEALGITPQQLIEEGPHPLLSERSTASLPHLKAWRTQAYLSQEMLAERASIDGATVKSLEAGRERASAHTLHALARALGITPQQLVEGPCHDL